MGTRAILLSCLPRAKMILRSLISKPYFRSFGRNFTSNQQPLHIVSPLLKSTTISKIMSSPCLPRNVYLKMDNAQPVGSFKIRGIGLTMQEAARSGCKRFVGSSEGNAGMAMAYAASRIGMKLSLFVPKDTPDFIE